MLSMTCGAPSCASMSIIASSPKSGTVRAAGSTIDSSTRTCASSSRAARAASSCAARSIHCAISPASASSPPSACATCARACNERIAVCTGPMSMGRGGSFAGASSSGLAVIMRTRAPTQAASAAGASVRLASPWLRSCASSMSANSAWTNGSSASGRVTDEKRTGTPSRRRRSPSVRIAPLSCMITAMLFHERPDVRRSVLMCHTTSSSSSFAERYRCARTVPSARCGASSGRVRIGNALASSGILPGR